MGPEEMPQHLLPKSGVGVAAPWLVISCPRNPVIRLDLRQLDRVAIRAVDSDSTGDDADEYDPNCELLLVRGELEVALYIEDGADAARSLVAQAAPLAHSVVADTEAKDPLSRDRLLFVGDDPVLHRGEVIQIGRIAFKVNEVSEYALQGASLPLPGNQVIRAAMAMLVVEPPE